MHKCLKLIYACVLNIYLEFKNYFTILENIRKNTKMEQLASCKRYKSQTGEQLVSLQNESPLSRQVQRNLKV